MREILFRGKYSKKSPDWIEGSFHRDEDTNICEIAYRYYKKENETKAGIWVYGVVDPETVGQYTGLTDKNGKKIFEGDIVRLTDEHNEMEWTAVVVFGNPNGDYNWGWQLNAIEEFDGNKDILLWVDMEESGVYCEIIGNIHDKKLEDFENGC